MATHIFSLTLYLFIFAWPFIAYLALRNYFVGHRFALYVICYLPMTLAASLRGDAGTDTEAYRDLFASIDPADGFRLGIDFLYMFLMGAVKLAGGGFQAFAFVHAGLCLLLYSYGASKVDTVAPVFALGILPTLFLDSTFNGLRYGLAFALAIALVQAYRSHRAYVLPLMLLPAAVHSSMAVMLALSPVVLGIGAMVLVAGGVAGSDAFMYLIYKQDAYTNIQRPGLLSGVFPLIQAIVLHCIFRMSRARFKIGFNFLSLGVALLVAGVILSSFTYAGLRILQIGVFVYAIGTALAVKTDDGRIAMVATLLGLAGVANMLRQILLVGPAGGVLFYPYDLFM